MHYPGYIGEFEEVDDHRNGKIVIQLNGRVRIILSTPAAQH
jgi:small subunit ribosomal protein S15Ae